MGDLQYMFGGGWDEFIYEWNDVKEPESFAQAVEVVLDRLEILFFFALYFILMSMLFTVILFPRILVVPFAAPYWLYLKAKNLRGEEA